MSTSIAGQLFLCVFGLKQWKVTVLLFRFSVPLHSALKCQLQSIHYIWPTAGIHSRSQANTTSVQKNSYDTHDKPPKNNLIGAPNISGVSHQNNCSILLRKHKKIHKWTTNKAAKLCFVMHLLVSTVTAKCATCGCSFIKVILHVIVHQLHVCSLFVFVGLNMPRTSLLKNAVQRSS